MKKEDIKLISLVVMGNVVDYYDFLLFAHLGYIITPFFMPSMDSTSSHLLSLLLFAMPFLARPLGGYVFGRISDLHDRQDALRRTIKYAGLASLGMALLPSYAFGGLLCSWMFFFLRFAQGFSLGGEYPTAGTFLMERYQQHQGLISGIMNASGTVGSLIAFGFAYLYINNYLSGEQWRIAFLIGALGANVAFFLRKKMPKVAPSKDRPAFVQRSDITLTVMIGALVSTSCYIPMVYSNFYLTKIYNLSPETGLLATLIALLGYVILTPVFGFVADKCGASRVMKAGAMAAIPFGLGGFLLIKQGNLMGQVLLIAVSAMFCAPIHAFMNRLFPPQKRSRFLNASFMAGTALGGLSPFLCGYFADNHQFYDVPVLLIMLFAVSFLWLIRKEAPINYANKTGFEQAL